MNQGRINFDADHLEFLYFNPLNANNSTSQTINTDPDHQFFSYTGNRYYVPEQFNDHITKFNLSLYLLHLKPVASIKICQDSQTFLIPLTYHFLLLGSQKLGYKMMVKVVRMMIFIFKATTLFTIA